ncbi:hypothetical protein T4B_2446 [Trichinella pseudospiralis]|uniref:Uncharacterized protein n=1 Tax=Trichinella pseudospiralis TaxID=6337 RepID=A0A0V1J7U4_TRIPS|nr:hypothetical protein T4A_7612 [Trichinella pseudospiralis]KRZ24558.1 hypothetical protein T4B_2446 [Trichinella pseudospiralis]KRZ31059.1 hypothetical protein T4C_11115 [Trichinella pseudospiralis]
MVFVSICKVIRTVPGCVLLDIISNKYASLLCIVVGTVRTLLAMCCSDMKISQEECHGTSENTHQF